MKNWQGKLKRTVAGLGVTAVYIFALVVMSVLVLCVCSVNELSLKGIIVDSLFLAIGNYLFLVRETITFPILLASLAAAQLLLLFRALRLAGGKRQSRRQRLVLVIITALLLAELHFWSVTAIFCGTWGEEGAKYMFYHLEVQDYDLISLATFLILWTVWTLILRWFTRSKESIVLFKYLLKWLAAAGVLILLIITVISLIPTKSSELKIIKEIINYLGVTAGLGVLLLCIVPWLILRSRRRQPRPDPPESPATEPWEQP